ncbi:hypothetical protein Tco_0153568 [Tanacetum coccineum]
MRAFERNEVKMDASTKETLMRHRRIRQELPPLKRVFCPVRNRILVYPDSDEEDEEYYSLPPLLPCFQTPQPCATFNSVHHNSHSEVDIDNMTLEDYVRYELAMSSMKSEIKVPTQGAENIRKMEHEVPNRCDDITDYEDSDQEDGELPDLPTFSPTNEFASVCEQLVQVDAHRVVLGLYLATGKHFKSGLVGYHADNDDGLELWMLLMEADLGHGLEHVVSSSSRAMLRGVFRSNSTLIFDFSFL